jgi:hypothetical protein
MRGQGLGVVLTAACAGLLACKSADPPGGAAGTGGGAGNGGSAGASPSAGAGGGPGAPGGAGGMAPAGGGGMPSGQGQGGQLGAPMARGERTSYLLTSSSLKSATAPRIITPLALTIGPGSKPCTIAGTQGLCVTPTRARGMVVNLSLGQGAGQPNPGAPPGPTDGRPARLFGSGEGLDRDGKIALAPFDLAAPKAIPGEGNLQDLPAGTNFTQLETLFGYMDVQVPLDGKFYTLRFAFYPQPIAEDATAKMCADANRLQNIAKNGAVIPGAAPFARGDVLFCEKAAQSDECAVADFKWMDATSSQLVATRPSKPRQLDFIVKEGIECKLYPEGPTPANHDQPGELRFNGFRMATRLTSPISVSARFASCGDKNFSVKDATGKITEGTSLAATINYDLDGFVFFPGVTDVAAASLADLLAAATLTPLHAREKIGPGPGSSEFSSATVTLALGTEPHPPCTGGPGPGDGGFGPSDGGPGGKGDAGSMNGPGPSDAPGGIHPPTMMPPGCEPNMPVRLSGEGGQPCTHKSCDAPEWKSFPYTAWSMKPYKNAGGRDCAAYCISQSCPGSAPAQLTCMPSCP